MARSKGINVDSTKTCALAPGYAMKTFTRGGAMFGNCEIGLVVMANIPRKTIANDMVIGAIGPDN